MASASRRASKTAAALAPLVSGNDYSRLNPFWRALLLDVTTYLPAYRVPRTAVPAHASRSTDTVHVRVRVCRDVEIYHVCYAFYIQTPRGHVGCDEHRNVTVAERLYRAQALVLAHPSVYRYRPEARGHQNAVDPTSRLVLQNMSADSGLSFLSA